MDEEDDGTGGGRRLMAAAAVYPEFSRASDGGPATIEIKWRHGEERYQSEAAEEGRYLFSVFFFLFGICPLK